MTQQQPRTNDGRYAHDVHPRPIPIPSQSWLIPPAIDTVADLLEFVEQVGVPEWTVGNIIAKHAEYRPEAVDAMVEEFARREMSEWLRGHPEPLSKSEIEDVLGGQLSSMTRSMERVWDYTKNGSQRLKPCRPLDESHETLLSLWHREKLDALRKYCESLSRFDQRQRMKNIKRQFDDFWNGANPFPLNTEEQHRQWAIEHRTAVTAAQTRIRQRVEEFIPRQLDADHAVFAARMRRYRELAETRLTGTQQGEALRHKFAREGAAYVAEDWERILGVRAMPDAVFIQQDLAAWEASQRIESLQSELAVSRAETARLRGEVRETAGSVASLRRDTVRATTILADVIDENTAATKRDIQRARNDAADDLAYRTGGFLGVITDRVIRGGNA